MQSLSRAYGNNDFLISAFVLFSSKIVKTSFKELSNKDNYIQLDNIS